MRYNFACILAAYLNDKEAARKLLDRTFAETRGGSQIRAAETDPDLDPLRDDPRFQRMLGGAKKRLGIDVADGTGNSVAALPGATE